MKWRNRFPPPQDILPGDHAKRLAAPYIKRLIQMELDADMYEAQGDRDMARGIRQDAAIIKKHLSRIEGIA